MIEPVEAEMARPAVLTPQQEAVLQDEDVERDARDRRDGGSQTTLREQDVEAGEKVHVEVALKGAEDPKQWSKGKKWCASPWVNGMADGRCTTIIVSLLCLTVALGSAMPTGDLGRQADEFGVSNIAVYLSITLFVVGFGVGPLLFAPRECNLCDARVSTR